MRIMRWALGAIVGLCGLFTLFIIYSEVAVKAGWMKEAPPEMARLVPYIEALGWWQLGVWTAAGLLFLLAAWRLFRGGRALLPFAGAVVLWCVHFAANMSMPVYRQAFSPAELQSDYGILAVNLLIAALIWWTERRKPAA